MIDYWSHTIAAMGVRPATADAWADTFARVMDERPFGSDHDLPNFLAQTLHESAMLQHTEENLSYSERRLTEVWPRRFPTIASARPYARNPRALANHVYGGRLGNDQPGDGWRYRGRGLIQITGKDNYRAMAHATGLPLIDEPHLLTQQEPALRASIAWWELNVPDALLGSVERITRIVNGGLNGIDHRRQLTRRAYRVLEAA